MYRDLFATALVALVGIFVTAAIGWWTLMGVMAILFVMFGCWGAGAFIGSFLPKNIPAAATMIVLAIISIVIGGLFLAGSRADEVIPTTTGILLVFVGGILFPALAFFFGEEQRELPSGRPYP